MNDIANSKTVESAKRKACTPCKIIAFTLLGLAGYGLYSLIERFVLST